MNALLDAPMTTELVAKQRLDIPLLEKFSNESFGVDLSSISTLSAVFAKTSST